MTRLVLLLVARGAGALRSSAGERLRLTFPGVAPAALGPAARRLPGVAAAERRGALDAKLKFARHVLGLADATDLLLSTPRFASVPLAVLVARHAALEREGVADASRGAADAVCGGGASHDDFCAYFGLRATPADVARRVAAVRRGGRRAAADGDLDVVRDLLARGWDPGDDADRRGASALHLAAGRGAADVARALAASMDVDALDARGASPLHYAACGVRGNAVGVGGELGALDLLLELGADARRATRDGNTVLMWAAWAGGPGAVRRILAAGADLAARNDRGCTAAHWACAGGDVATVRLLSGLGVDFSAPNDAGHTPLEHAVAYKRVAAAEWLVAAGVVDPSAVEYAARLAALDGDGDRAAISTALGAFAMPPI